MEVMGYRRHMSGSLRVKANDVQVTENSVCDQK